MKLHYIKGKTGSGFVCVCLFVCYEKKVGIIFELNDREYANNQLRPCFPRWYQKEYQYVHHG